MANVTIISDVPTHAGWAPVLHMQRLLAIAAGADLYDVSLYPVGRVQRLLNRIAARRRSTNDNTVLFISPSAHGVAKFLPVVEGLGGYARAALWIVDSFWTEATAECRRLIDRHFDLVIHMQAYDDDFYRGLFGQRSLRLEWGSDVLGLGGGGGARDFDLLRVGRQPPEWDDDGETEARCRALGLRFAGRPPFAKPAEVLPGLLMGAYYGRTKYVLAHSNVAAPAPYTHPTKAYVTGRWTDAIASGAAVAGRPPDGDLGILDWPEALLVLPSLDREEGLRIIADAAARWTPDIARINFRQSLRKLDWRWRFRSLLGALELASPLLDQQIADVESRIAGLPA